MAIKQEKTGEMRPLTRKPAWLKVRAPHSPGYQRVREIVQNHGLHTVCESASCPNVGQCWHEGAAAFMILGAICTRRCAFCDVRSGRPDPVDTEEPQRLARAVHTMGLKHVVVTSVDRDDLEDGGARHFVRCIQALRSKDPMPTIEVLTPDFWGKDGALQRVLAARPEVFNHNVETVARLFPVVRPKGQYAHSLAVLRQASQVGEGLITKSSLMLGLGETFEEVILTMEDLRQVGVVYLTLGQYLRPSLAHHPVERYWPPDQFDVLRQRGLAMGFVRVESHPLARSSFHARH